MKLDEYIKKLEQLQDDIPDVVDGFIKKRSNYMVGNVKNRFFNYGVDGDGNLIGGGVYAERTKKRKNKEGKRTSHITLLDTREWWNSLYASYHNGELELNSTMTSLTEKLIYGEGKRFAGYGPAIMEFTREEKILFEDEILTDLGDYLQRTFNTNEDIEL